jgi:hypothetical protein
MGLMNNRWFATPCLPGAVLVAAAVLLTGCQGKGAAGICAEAGDCGGDPTGVWQISTDPTLSCHFPVFSRPAQNYANSAPYFQPETGAVPPAVTSGGWCWDLSFGDDGRLATPGVPMPNPDVVVSGTVTFSADQSYTYILTATSTTAFHVARSCFGVNGANLGAGGAPTTCDDFSKKLLESGIGVNPVYMSLTAGTPAFACHPEGDGCDCTFAYIETDQNAVGDKGTWVKDGNLIHHYSITGQGNFFETSPSRRTVRDATFCVTDNRQTLQLTGTNGTALALKAGTRTLTLTRVAPVPDAGTNVVDAGGTDGAQSADDGAGMETGVGMDAEADGVDGSQAGDGAGADGANPDAG